MRIRSIIRVSRGIPHVIDPLRSTLAIVVRITVRKATTHIMRNIWRSTINFNN
ncbi:uncharacterized protein DS421_20g692660 [Arachis hypogaea]|nr:uncharacterized protein DS421_20g692660 [Arachis hypogaea]